MHRHQKGIPHISKKKTYFNGINILILCCTVVSCLDSQDCKLAKGQSGLQDSCVKGLSESGAGQPGQQSQTLSFLSCCHMAGLRAVHTALHLRPDGRKQWRPAKTTIFWFVLNLRSLNSYHHV